MSWMSWMSINTQDDPQCSWMSWRSWMSWMSINTKGDPWCSWMSIVAQVVLWCTKTFIWRVKITLDVAKCLGWLLMNKLCLNTTKGFMWMLQMTLPAAGYLGCVLMLKLFPDTPIECILMNLLCLHELRELCTCSRCPLMQLDVLDGFDAQDDPWHSWMSNNSQVVLWCTETFLWMVKITLVVAGCLGCL